MNTRNNKTTLQGTKEFVDPETGEIVPLQIIQTDVKDVDTNFTKLFMKDFIHTLDIVSNKKTKVCYWILDNITKDNLLNYSYRQIADKTGTSYDTVQKTIKELINADFLRKDGKILIVNPKIVFKGSHSRRMNVLHTYTNAETGDIEVDNQKRIDDINKTINNLIKTKASLEYKKAMNEGQIPGQECL